MAIPPTAATDAPMTTPDVLPDGQGGSEIIHAIICYIMSPITAFLAVLSQGGRVKGQVAQVTQQNPCMPFTQRLDLFLVYVPCFSDGTDAP